MLRVARLFFSSFLLCYLVHPVVAASVDDGSKTITIGVIGKTKKDSFYEQAFAGCQAFAREHKNIECLYDGPELFQDIREQVLATQSLIAKGVDGIIISTTESQYLSDNALRLAKDKGIPVITFDSDLLPEHQQYRLAYVGTNNFEFGVALGLYATKFKGEGITEVCIQSGHAMTPNLNERIRGVRYALSGMDDNSRLTGIQGWREYSRCPFYNLGKRDMALKQLELLLKKSVPVYIAVAGFAQFSDDYIERIMPYREQIQSGRSVIISADTETVQLEALKLGLSTVNIGQRPFEMGRLSSQMLVDYILDGKQPAQEFNYLGFHYCTALNSEHCVAN